MDGSTGLSDIGWVYCMSNPHMNNIIKIGMTMKHPEDRLKDANSHNTWVCGKFKINFAKQVSNPKEIEKKLHNVISKNHGRVEPSTGKEFFRATPDEVFMYFDILTGVEWIDKINSEKDIDTKSILPKRLDMRSIFTHAQQIRHILSNDRQNIMIGEYNLTKNRIIGPDKKEYRSPSGFAREHYRRNNIEFGHKNGWKLCEYEIGNNWKSTSDF